MPALYLRKVIHPQARDNYRVLLKGDDGLEVEVGSIGVQQGSAGAEHWAWGIDTAIPMRETDARGNGKDRKDCMKPLQATWDEITENDDRL